MSSLRKTLSGRRPIIKYLVQRFAVYGFTLWASISLAFFAFRLMPGDPMETYLRQLERAQGDAEKATYEARVDYFRERFRLDDPLHVQYITWARNVVLGGFDLGPSFIAYPKPARDLIFEHMPWTIGIFTTSMLIAWAVGTGIGAMLGWLRRRGFTNIAVSVATLLQITPVYLIALGLIIFVGYELRWLPARGPYAPHLQRAWTWEFISSMLQHITLPMLSMIFVWGAGFTLGMRALMISVLGEDYLTFAKAKGLSTGAILKDYAFRNALIPQVASLAIALGVTLNGVIIIEVLFVLPGIGNLFARALGLRDYNVMQGVVVFSIFTVLTLTLIVDLVLPLLDPRVRIEV